MLVRTLSAGDITLSADEIQLGYSVTFKRSDGGNKKPQAEAWSTFCSALEVLTGMDAECASNYPQFNRTGTKSQSIEAFREFLTCVTHVEEPQEYIQQAGRTVRNKPRDQLKTVDLDKYKF